MFSPYAAPACSEYVIFVSLAASEPVVSGNLLLRTENGGYQAVGKYDNFELSSFYLLWQCTGVKSINGQYV